MKRLIFSVAICSIMLSCKKNYTCYCGDWNSKDKTPVFTVKDTKKKAQKKCGEYRDSTIAIPEYTCTIQ